jgi:hypothetical protein
VHWGGKDVKSNRASIVDQATVGQFPITRFSGPIDAERNSYGSDFGLANLKQEMTSANLSLSKISMEEAVTAQVILGRRISAC